MKKVSFSDKIFSIISTIMLVIVLILCLYPLMIVVFSSVSDPTLVNQGKIIFMPKGFQLGAYKYVLNDNRIIIGYLNTILYTVFGTLFSVFMTVCAGFSISRKEMVGRKWIMWFFLIPMYIGGGLIPTYLQALNLHLVGSRWSMIIMGAFSIWNLIVCRTFFETSIPGELWEAASIDGCTIYRFFISIVLPNAKAIIAIMVLYYAIGQWNDYFRALIYLSSGDQYPLQLVMQNILLANQMSRNNVDPSVLSELSKQADAMKYALIVISSAPVIALYPFVQKYFVKGVMIGSIKG